MALTVTLPAASNGQTLKIENLERKAIRINGNVVMDAGQSATCAALPVNDERPEDGAHWVVSVEGRPHSSR